MQSPRKILWSALGYGSFFAVATSLAAFAPHALFSDHAVLQRGVPLKVWGTADPGEAIQIQFLGESVQTTTNPSGNWELTLSPATAGGPHSMTLIGESSTLTVRDLLIGEVWLAGGQSNMEWRLGDSNSHSLVVNAASAIASAELPSIRQFEVPNTVGYTPAAEVDAEWVVCSPETAAQHSAVAFFFARALSAQLDVPIGILNSNWGGTRAQAWMSANALAQFPRYAADLEKVDATHRSPEAAWKQAEADIVEWYRHVEPPVTVGPPRQAPEFDDSAWKGIDELKFFDVLGLEDFDGTIWFRKTFELPASWVDKSVALELGPIDDDDSTWINGVEVGSMRNPILGRRYAIPTGTLQEGENCIALRVIDFVGGGGFKGTPEDYALVDLNDPTQRIVLGHQWRISAPAPIDPDNRFPPYLPDKNRNLPSVLYKGMIAPLVGFPLKGVIWYQGESNAYDSTHYKELFPALIEDWRQAWEQPEMPFLFVQIAPFQDQPPEIREAQLHTLQTIENTAMVVTIDVGDPTDIHPANKEPVGERLALAARAIAYGEDTLTFSGPIFREMKIEGKRAILHFDSVGAGLFAPPRNDLIGFTIAGEDGAFIPAEASIEGSTVIVEAPQVESPVAVRYGWENVAHGNLFNRAGLPASPFRTDFPAP